MSSTAVDGWTPPITYWANEEVKSGTSVTKNRKEAYKEREHVS